MLKVNVNGNRSQIEATGSTEEIMTDICLIINGIYATMLNRNKELAHIFRKGFTRVVVDPDSVLWDASASRGTGLMMTVPNVHEGDGND